MTKSILFVDSPFATSSNN